ncbi:MAG: caspase family protein [Desulfobacteraceae bacterium]|nr:caspase family protein [Desulfobacteraceae bacterium]
MTEERYIIVIVMTLLNLTSAAYAGKYALVIGNGSYKAVPALDTPVNDANVMASSLRDLNFSVEKGTDMSQQEMETAIENFRKRLHTGDIALFYYSGHGVQVDKINYMLPVEISKDKIRYNSVSVNIVLDKMEEAGSKVNIIILDACRVDFKGGKGFGKGLAEMHGGEGTYIAYATAPGTEAYTGSGSTSIYTRHLVNAMKTPGLKIEDVFKQVRKAVMDETSRSRSLGIHQCLSGIFILPKIGK